MAHLLQSGRGGAPVLERAPTPCSYSIKAEGDIAALEGMAPALRAAAEVCEVRGVGAACSCGGVLEGGRAVRCQRVLVV